ncbi:MAG: 1-deoxy-D-xylulose-5-phosphate reductoisomerase [Thermodesulfovibrionia bacterium]|nr:1-deoxy-D-xylulose-5-phosphate reductoisomerase [Thermodesulfovibrionia bacterium]
MKNISVLGSTGSIGRATLEVVRCFPDRFNVVGLAAKDNIGLLESQVHAFKPEVIAVSDEAAGRELKKKNLPVEILTGDKGLEEIATITHVDMVVSAIVGSAALMPTYAAIRAGKDIALASKETLVMAGSIIMAEASRKGISVIPVDSEHSAIFQCLNGRKGHEVQKIILTASGGAFLRKDLSELEKVTPEEALKHPNWLMGKKITIDSATLMNKGLEVIEAHWLFGLPAEKISVVLHPQSIVHSMVEFIDGSILAQLSVPDMKGPISYALSYPDRFGDVLPPLDFSKIRMLTFEETDWKKYRCLGLSYNALNTGGTMPSVLNAANEVAVEAFLNKRILFTEIPDVVLNTMSQHKISDCKTIGDVIEASNWARKKSEDLINERRD